MQISYNQILSNGAIQAFMDPMFVGFIFGALDHGWSVLYPGCVKAKKGKVIAVTHSQGKDRGVYFFVGKEKVLELPLQGFQWNQVKLIKGNLYHNERFITSTK